MKDQYIQILNTFTLESLPDLDVGVLGALELLEKTVVPRMDMSNFKRPLVIGSGNAEATGRIVFRNSDAVFASESDYQERLATIPLIDSVVVLSASGGKHAPGIVRSARVAGKRVMLITNTPDSLASHELADTNDALVFPKNREPYTYNTSTYMGMILGSTDENAGDIQRYIHESIETIHFPDFSSYDKFFVVVPPRLGSIKRMLQVKFIELFGRIVARDVETSEYMSHAVTVVPSRELFINIGVEGGTWGTPENNLYIPLPPDADYVAIMAIGYYIIGQIQKSHPPYFKNNIALYCENAGKAFGTTIPPIVEK